MDINKRKTLQTLGVAGAGTAALIGAPSALAVMQSAQAVDSNGTLKHSSGVSIKHYDNFEGHTVLFQNETDRAITLRRFPAGIVNTPKGSFDLNSAIQEQGFTIPANATQAVSITSTGKAHRYAQWTSLGQAIPVAQTGGRMQKVRVVGQYAGNHGSMSNMYLANLHVV